VQWWRGQTADSSAALRNDRQKSKCKVKGNGKYSGPSLRSRMTRFWVSESVERPEKMKRLFGEVVGLLAEVFAEDEALYEHAEDVL